MRTVTLQRVDRLNDFNFENPGTIVQASAFLLTRLVSENKGSIFAIWDRSANSAVWKQTGETDFIFVSPTNSTEVLKVEDLSVFRSMLARLGFLLCNDGYLGAGTFKVYFENEVPNESLFAILFSNSQATGYWMKLQKYDVAKRTTDRLNVLNTPIKEHKVSKFIHALRRFLGCEKV